MLQRLIKLDIRTLHSARTINYVTAIPIQSLCLLVEVQLEILKPPEIGVPQSQGTHDAVDEH